MIRMNIRGKFIIPTIALIVAGMGISIAVSYVESKKSLSRSLLDNIVQRTDSVGLSLKSWLKDRRLDVKSWAQESVFIEATNTSFMGKAARLGANDILVRLMGDYEYYEDIILLDREGTVIAANTADAVGKFNLKDREYFKVAIKGAAYISDVSLSRRTGNPVFFVAAPVLRDNAPEGVLVGIVNIDSFSKWFIDSVKIGNSGYAFAVNAKGMVIAHPDRARILKENLGNYDFGKTMIERKKGLISYEYENVNKTVAFTTIEGVNWLVAVNVPDEEVLSPINRLRNLNIMVATVIISIAMGLIFFIAKTVVTPINQVVAGLKDAAQGDGDLTKRITTKSRDEAGELAKWFNVFIEKIQYIISDVAQNANNLTSSSRELADIAGRLSENADQTSAKATAVSVASGQMSATITDAAGIIDQTASNLTSVSTGAEEMAETISGIADNTKKGRLIAEDAVVQTSSATSRISELGDSAIEINKIVETITEISEQINLLALNATIESARAGEAGKGFAVVANEIKELARQTAAASNEIKQQVGGIQASTRESVDEINSISGIVGELNDLVSSIARAIEGQSVTTKDIADNVANASEGMGGVNTVITNGAAAAGSITEDIADVNRAAEDMSGTISRVNKSSLELTELAEKLNDMVKQFKV